MKRIVLSLTAVILSVCATAHAQQCSGCEKYQRTKARAKIPFNGPMICLNYIQAGRDKVVVRFVRDGKDIHTVSNETGPRDRFCFGRWRFVRPEVVPDEIWFCNGTKSARLDRDDIGYLSHRGMRASEYVCLLGSKECRNRALVQRND